MLLIVQKPVRNCGTHDAGRRLWPQRETLTVAILETEHFLFDDVRVLADRPLEQLRALKQRHPYFSVAIGREDLPCHRF